MTEEELFSAFPLPWRPSATHHGRLCDSDGREIIKICLNSNPGDEDFLSEMLAKWLLSTVNAHAEVIETLALAREILSEYRGMIVDSGTSGAGGDLSTLEDNDAYDVARFDAVLAKIEALL